MISSTPSSASISLYSQSTYLFIFISIYLHIYLFTYLLVGRIVLEQCSRKEVITYHWHFNRVTVGPCETTFLYLSVCTAASVQQ
jgi:hypothetical protein